MQNRTALVGAVLHDTSSSVAGPLPIRAGAHPAREGGVDIFVARAAAAVTLTVAAIAASTSISVAAIAGGISIGPCRAGPAAIVAAVVSMPHGFDVLGLGALERQRRR